MQVEKLIAEVVPFLVEETIAIAKRLRTTTQMFRLKFWYYDTCAPCCYFLAHGLTVAERDDIIKYDGISAGYNLWDKTGSIEFDVGDLSERTTPSKSLMAKAYAYMSMEDAQRAAVGLSNDALIMSRLIAQKLSLQLNAFDWSQVCSVTDDFIVYAQNGTDYGCDCYEDLIASVPIQKLQLLRDRGWMGPGERYSSIAAGNEQRPPQVWVNSFELFGTETNVQEYVSRLIAFRPPIHAVELIPRGREKFIITVSHETLESDVFEDFAPAHNVEVGGGVPRTDLWRTDTQI